MCDNCNAKDTIIGKPGHQCNCGPECGKRNASTAALVELMIRLDKMARPVILDREAENLDTAHGSSIPPGYIAEVIDRINDDIYAQNGDDERVYMHMDYAIGQVNVYFLEQHIWSSEDDERPIVNESKEIYASFEGFIRATVNKVIAKIAGLRV